MPIPSVAIPKGIEPITQEEDYVHTIYNEIASHFSQTRYKPWPIVEKFLKSRDDYSVGIDVGCGNGKYLGVNKKLFMIGTDRSDGLIDCGRDISTNSYNLGVADGLHLPHSEGSMDFAISIAVIHHFSTEERRIDGIRHILSKLKSGGELLVYCWALEQESSKRGYKEGDEQDILIPWVLQPKKEKTEKVKKVKERKPRKEKKNKKVTEGLENLQLDDIPGNARSQQFPEALLEISQPVPETSALSESSEPLSEISQPLPETPEPLQLLPGTPEQPTEPDTKYRYYHLYKKGELGDNALKAGGNIVEEGYEKDNWWVIIKKT